MKSTPIFCLVRGIWALTKHGPFRTISGTHISVTLQVAFCRTPSWHEQTRAPSRVLPIVYSTTGTMNKQELHPKFSPSCPRAARLVGGEDRQEGGQVTTDVRAHVWGDHAGPADEYQGPRRAPEEGAGGAMGVQQGLGGAMGADGGWNLGAQKGARRCHGSQRWLADTCIGDRWTKAGREGLTTSGRWRQ
jgi:hypothetical protein